MYQLSIKIQGGVNASLEQVAAQLDIIKAAVLSGHPGQTQRGTAIRFTFEVREVDEEHAYGDPSAAASSAERVRSLSVLQEADPRAVAPLEPGLPVYDDAGREYSVLSSSNQQVVTCTNGVYGLWDRRTGECLVANCEGIRLSNERPSDEWLDRRRLAAVEVFSGMHADAAIARASERPRDINGVSPAP
ncbi:hypothetical protein [Cupriavidus sp. TMH.W2]|uniref:hypothetical protein n=1 Tax=Cupriavidus sp. TMH.W2 TaxID=3434465 RepID=UPI003D7882B7